MDPHFGPCCNRCGLPRVCLSISRSLNCRDHPLIGRPAFEKKLARTLRNNLLDKPDERIRYIKLFNYNHRTNATAYMYNNQGGHFYSTESDSHSLTPS
jgi:hypothetical protein